MTPVYSLHFCTALLSRFNELNDDDDDDNVNNLKYVWIILLKNDLFGFPKVKWLQYTGEVGKCTSY